MTAPGYVVVAETGLARNSYGASIIVSNAMPERRAREFLAEVVAGKHPGFCQVPPDAEVMRPLGAEGYLVVTRRRLAPPALTRLTLASQGPPGAGSPTGGS